MEVYTVIEMIKLAGNLAGALIAISGGWALIAKKPKEWIRKTIRESMQEDFEDIKAKLNRNDESTKCVLRHSITGIYEQYKVEKKIPSIVKQNVCSLYNSYTELGGNSYVHQIYEEMMSWQVE